MISVRLLCTALCIGLFVAVPPACAAPPAGFLPDVKATGTSPTLERGGREIPLRPEMLGRDDLAVSIPQVSQSTLENGIRLFALESHSLPGLYFTVLLKTGSVLDPPDKVGLAALTASTLRAGGTQSMSPEEFDQRLDEIGSSLSVSAERNVVRVDMFALSHKRDEALQMLADLLTSPGFAEREFEQRKALQLEELRRQNDEPGDVARREFRRLIYGADNPLGRAPTSSTVSAITLANVRQFYEDYYAPSVAWFGVSGDVSPAQAGEMVQARFGAWRKPAPAVAALPQPTDPESSRPQIILIPRQAAQSQIRLGHLTIPRNDPMQVAGEVMSSIYGMSGFSSRLLTEVRTRLGYAYAVGGGVQVDEPRGIFFAAASSKTASTCGALKAMLAVTTGTAEGQFTERELDIARREVIHSFITRFDVPREIVYNRMNYDLLGYPADYVDTFAERVRNLGAADVAAAARTLIHPSRLRVLVVGNPEAMDCDLSTVGDVTTRTLESGGEAPAPVTPAAP